VKFTYPTVAVPSYSADNREFTILKIKLWLCWTHLILLQYFILISHYTNGRNILTRRGWVVKSREVAVKLHTNIISIITIIVKLKNSRAHVQCARSDSHQTAKTTIMFRQVATSKGCTPEFG